MFLRALDPLERDFTAADSLGLAGLLELAERSREAVDELWAPSECEGFPEARMARLLAVIGAALAQAVRNHFARADMWAGRGSIRDELRAAAAVCARWSTACAELGRVWVRPRRAWSGPPLAGMCSVRN